MQTPPVLKARLVHAEPSKRVVQVSAWQGERCLGSCLGEAADAEEAEERAKSRLLQRLGQAATEASAAEAPAAAGEAKPEAEPSPGAQPGPQSEVVRNAVVRHPVVRNPAAPQPPSSDAPDAATTSDAQPDLFTKAPAATSPAPMPAAPPPLEPAADPEDWSEELAELDVQLQRIGWDRSQEGVYLQRAFGHPSRNRLTAYADLVSYLRCLRHLPNGCDASSAAVPLRRKDLLEQSDQLLQSLRWDAQQGRQLLEQQFQLSSRQQLNDEQLLQFNMLLEEALIQQHSGQPAAAGPG